MSSRTLWLGAATGGAVALFVGGLSMLVLPEYRAEAGFGLSALGILLAVYVYRNVAASRREDKLTAIERSFKELPAGIFAQRIDEEDYRWRIFHSDRLVRIRCEKACESAAKTIKDIRRYASSFPNEVLTQFDGISTWIAILVHLNLHNSSLGERMLPDLASPNPRFEDVATASLAACNNLRQKK